MDFFGEQQAARRNTRWLVMLFLLAVVTIVVVLYVVLIGIIGYSTSARAYQSLQLWQPDLFLMVAVSVSTVILLASLYKTVQLSSGGGSMVAESLGGRLVSRSTTDTLERRLLNVVDEMAIASGIPVPKVYLLDHEYAINAFAAGSTTSDAVVAVTRGTLEQLNRDELQGVIGHEFSHIFNGDMRLNIRLMGVLHGILVLALIGQTILRGSSRGYRVRTSSSGNKGGGIVLFALALFVIGYIGVFFGRLIKAAVSRQREFLADASAVQFTRNPSGIAGALKKIAGIGASHIEHPEAESASHMFFGNGVNNLLSLLATHPPVEERIRRLDPYFEMMTGAGQRQPASAATGGVEAVSGFSEGGAGGSNLTAQAVRSSVGNYDHKHLNYARSLMERLPEEVWKGLRDAEGAYALILAMIVSRGMIDHKALTILLPSAPPARMAQIMNMAALLSKVERHDWLPLVELAVPALEELPRERLTALPDELDILINADKRVTLFEFALATMLRHTICERVAVPREMQSGGMRVINQDLSQLLSLMAHAGHTEEGRIRNAFNEAVMQVGSGEEIRLLPRSGLSLKQVESAMQRLSHLNMRFKAKVIEAATAAIMADGEVKLTELDLLRAIGASLDCPIPPLQVGKAEMLEMKES